MQNLRRNVAWTGNQTQTEHNKIKLLFIFHIQETRFNSSDSLLLCPVNVNDIKLSSELWSKHLTELLADVSERAFKKFPPDKRGHVERAVSRVIQITCVWKEMDHSIFTQWLGLTKCL